MERPNISFSDNMNITDFSNSTNLTDSIEEFIVDFRKYYKYGFEIILYGYFIPVWVLMSILMYSLMVVVFVKYGMTSSTHVCLIAIAVCDSISPLAPTATWVYFFAIKKYNYYLPFEWCRTYHYTTEVIPQLFTYTSYFLTIVMTVHRYILMAHPFKADKLCSRSIIYTMIFVCFLTSVGIRVVHLFHYGYISKTVPAEDKFNSTMQACSYTRPNWMQISFFKYLGILFTVQTIFVGILPCTVLVIAEIMMLNAINARSAKRQMMISTGSNNKTRNAKSERRLSVATIVITAVTLFYMIPLVIIQVIDVSTLMFGVKIGDYNNLRTAVVVLNVLYWMCIPSNFLITCCLSYEFRMGIRRLFVKPETVHTSTASIVTITTKTETSK